MTDLIKEAQEELRRERINALFQRGLPWLIGLSLAVIAIVALQTWLVSRAEQFNSQQAETYWNSANPGEGAQVEAVDLLRAIASDSVHSGYRSLASAGVSSKLSLQTGTVEIAARDFERLANDSTAPDAVRDFAALRSALLYARFADIAEIERRLQPFRNDGGIVGGLVDEALAYAYYRNGSYEKATELVDSAVENPEYSVGIRTRMQVLRGLISSEGAS